MQENHGLYVNRTEPIHLMTEVTSVLGSTINNITCCLKEGDYKNRSKLQK